MVCEFLFRDIIEKNKFLQGKPRGFLRKLFMALTPNFLNMGDAIYFKGEPAEYVYFVIKGRLATKCGDS
jgi:CRP-like cAMP-binding protein